VRSRKAALDRGDHIVIVDDVRMVIGGPAEDVGELNGRIGTVVKVWYDRFDSAHNRYDVKVGKRLFTYRADRLRVASPLDLLAEAGA
jgi:hypothetical protein